ncbi:MAG: Gfo/Idh/MocA family oxidoreductase [Dehalococcoidia bacterium]|nr:Gfo/Idh/MocA family oxidoreductase [Dehalococcoidia bacterium]
MTAPSRGRFRWAVLGPGFVATRAVMPAIARSRNGTLYAVASRDQARAAAAARPFDAARAYGSYEAALADPEVDGVYIALPNDLHAHWAIRAAEAGKHVLCEKPLAPSAHDASAIAAACAQAGVLLMEAVMYRFHPRSRHIDAIIGAGTLGEPRAIEAAFTFPLRASAGYRLEPDRGGGALLDVGCYGVNAARWIAGGEPDRVVALSKGSPVDWRTDAILGFPGGITAHVLAAFDAYEYQRLTIVGTDGTLSASLAFTAWRHDPTTLQLRTQRGETVVSFPPADPYQLMVEQFAAAAWGEEPPLLAPDDGVKSARVLDAIRHALASGRLILP